MDVRFLSDIDGDGHAYGGFAQGESLGFAELRPDAVAGLRGDLSVVGQLDKQKRKIALPPMPPPVADQRRGEEHTILATRAARIALALVPDHSANAVGNEGLDHADEKIGREVAPLLLH